MNLTRRGGLFASVLALAVLFAVACGSDKKDETKSTTTAGGGTQAAATAGPAGSPAAQAQGQPSGKQEFRFNLGGEPDTLDPSKASFDTEITVINTLWRGLFTFDKELKLVADLAAQLPTKENGGVSADGTKYTFKIKPNQMFSDGVPVTSKHFAFALKRAATPGLSGDYQDFFTEIKGGDKLAALKPDDPGIKAAQDAMAIQTPDDQTLVVEIAEPNRVFLQYMALWPSYPLREDLIAKFGDKWTEAGNLVGNGPFLLKEWKHKEQITLARNDKYSGTDKPKLETIVLRMIEDRNQAYNAYLAGEVDRVSVPSELTKTVQADPNLKKENIKSPRLSTFAAQMNNTKAPFDNKKVRQAFATAIDREAMVNGPLQGINKPATSWIPLGMPGYDASLGSQYKVDAAKAKQLLSEAGFANGQGLPKIVFVYTNTGNNPIIAEFLKEQWNKNLGVNVDLEPVDSKTFQARIKAKDFGFAFFGWGADYPDPENFLAPNFKTNAGNNKAGYSNKEFDALIDKAKAETDNKKALDYLTQAHKILVDDSPHAFLFFNELNVVQKPYVKGYFEAPFNASRFWTEMFIQK